MPIAHIIPGGALTAEKLTELKSKGVEAVINLRSEQEMQEESFDEQAAVKEAEMDYITLPIAGPDDLTRERVSAFDHALNKYERVHVHCASGNRVGAMVALRAAMHDGVSSEEALTRGKEAGLTKLEGAVRARLDKLSST